MSLSAALNNNRTWNRHGLKIAWALAIFLFLLIAAGIAYSEYTNRNAKMADYAAQDLPPISNNSAPQYRVTEITSANLFGDPRPKQVINKNIPKTNLNLKLIGVLWASDQGMGRVIIQSGNKNANLYSIGDDIEGANASVKEINTNEILISRNGATEKLALVERKSAVLSYANKSDPSQAPANHTIPTIPPLPTTTAGGTSSNRKPISANGENRKIRKPNFSGLDRALKRMNEL